MIENNIYLASGSKSRRQLLEEVGISFQGLNSNIDEKFAQRPDEPSELVSILAKMKTQNLTRKINNGIIIGLDSVMYFEGKIFEKPIIIKNAITRLKNLSGKTFESYTGIYGINLDNAKEYKNVIITQVKMRELDDIEIYTHVFNRLEVLNNALGFDPLDKSADFVECVNGCDCNFLYGLPLDEFLKTVKYLS